MKYEGTLSVEGISDRGKSFSFHESTMEAVLAALDSPNFTRRREALRKKKQAMVGNERGDRDVRGSVASRHGGNKKPVYGSQTRAKKVECDPPKRNIGRRETLVPPVKLGESQNSSSAHKAKVLRASGNTTRRGYKYVNVWVADIGRPYSGRWARFIARRIGCIQRSQPEGNRYRA